MIQNNSYQLIELESVDSTNRFLKDYAKENLVTDPVFCTAKEQTAGYGQQNRSWYSNAASIVFSLAYPLPAQSVISGLLSLNIAALLHQSLAELTQETLFLKWPNDLFNHQGKVAGILIEQVSHKNNRTLIIGIGINRTQIKEKLSGETTLQSGAISNISTQALLSQFFSKLSNQKILPEHPEPLLDYWTQHDLFKTGESILFYQNETSQMATYQGINEQGQATILVNHQKRVLSSGLSSIRKLS